MAEESFNYMAKNTLKNTIKEEKKAKAKKKSKGKKRTQAHLKRENVTFDRQGRREKGVPFQNRSGNGHPPGIFSVPRAMLTVLCHAPKKAAGKQTFTCL